MAINHFQKHGVRAMGDKPYWNFNVIFDNPAVTRMAERYAPLLRHEGLYDPIPPRWLHATILAIAPVEELAETEMLAVVDNLTPRLARLDLPEFRFDSWWLWGGNVVLHISPEDQFTKIYDAVIEAMRQTLGSERTPLSPYGKFIPHTGLAYTRTHNKEYEINERLAKQPIQPAAFKVDYLPLIRQWPQDGHYEWEIVRKIPIGKAVPSQHDDHVH